MLTLRGIKTALVVTICFFAVAAVYASFTIVKRQNQLREVSRYNIVWAASQALAELHRFEHRVAAYALPFGGVDKDEVQKRFDVMFNRLNILKGGDPAALTEAHVELQPVVGELDRVLNELDPLVQDIERPGNVEKVLEGLKPLENKLIRFAATANQFGGAQVADDHQTLQQMHWLFSGAAAGLFLCGVMFIGLLFFQNRMIHKAHQDLHALAIDLQRSNDAAVAGSEAKSRFLANMSHELRTPLNAIIGFSEIIMNESFGPLGQPKYREYAADILRSGKHMHELVNDILTMAKLDAGHFELNIEPIDLRQVVESTLDIFRGTEMAKGREIAVTAGSQWPPLDADERAIRQMLLNLLSNALKFSAPETPVGVQCNLGADGEVSLAVIDYGIGMTPAQAEMAVKPFHQIDNGLARKYEGTWLGLSIVKGLIESHGGRLTIDSVPGEGTRIALVFPRTLAARSAIKKAA